MAAGAAWAGPVVALGAAAPWAAATGACVPPPTSGSVVYQAGTNIQGFPYDTALRPADATFSSPYFQLFADSNDTTSNWTTKTSMHIVVYSFTAVAGQTYNVQVRYANQYGYGSRASDPSGCDTANTDVALAIVNSANQTTPPAASNALWLGYTQTYSKLASVAGAHYVPPTSVAGCATGANNFGPPQSPSTPPQWTAPASGTYYVQMTFVMDGLTANGVPAIGANGSGGVYSVNDDWKVSVALTCA